MENISNFENVCRIIRVLGLWIQRFWPSLLYHILYKKNTYSISSKCSTQTLGGHPCLATFHSPFCMANLAKGTPDMRGLIAELVEIWEKITKTQSHKGWSSAKWLKLLPLAVTLNNMSPWAMSTVSIQIPIHGSPQKNGVHSHLNWNFHTISNISRGSKKQAVLFCNKKSAWEFWWHSKKGGRSFHLQVEICTTSGVSDSSFQLNGST